MPGGQQTRKRELALAALLTEPTVEAAAQKAQVSHRTLKYWLAEPQFYAEYRARCRAVLDMATATLAGATDGAVACLRRNMECGKASAEIRAALGILTHAIQAAELADVVKRLDELERALDRRRTPQPLNGTEPDTTRNGHESHDCQEAPG